MKGSLCVGSLNKRYCTCTGLGLGPTLMIVYNACGIEST